MPTTMPTPLSDEHFRLSSRRPTVELLAETSRQSVLRHYLALGPDDRYLRFGFSITDAQIKQYTENLDFASDTFIGIFVDSEIVALCHAAVAEFGEELAAELGLSVHESHRGQKLGYALLSRAVEEGGSRGWAVLKVQYLAHNSAMASLVRKFDASCEREFTEVTASISLKPVYEAEGTSDYLTALV